jgi:hypothetical protein
MFVHICSCRSIAEAALVISNRWLDMFRTSMSSVALLLLSLSCAGARKLLRWEQQIMLHAGSGTTVLPAEVKAKMRVSAAELQEETGLSTAGLQHILAIAGNRYEYLTTAEAADWSFELCASSALCVHAAQKG